jgi:hypothetical protein
MPCEVDNEQPAKKIASSSQLRNVRLLRRMKIRPKNPTPVRNAAVIRLAALNWDISNAEGFSMNKPIPNAHNRCSNP